MLHRPGRWGTGRRAPGMAAGRGAPGEKDRRGEEPPVSPLRPQGRASNRAQRVALNTIAFIKNKKNVTRKKGEGGRGRRVWKRSEKSSKPGPFAPRRGRSLRAGCRRGAADRRWQPRVTGRRSRGCVPFPGGARGTRPPPSGGSPGSGGRMATLAPDRTCRSERPG